MAYTGKFIDTVSNKEDALRYIKAELHEVVHTDASYDVMHSDYDEMRDAQCLAKSADNNAKKLCEKFGYSYKELYNQVYNDYYDPCDPREDIWK